MKVITMMRGCLYDLWRGLGRSAPQGPNLGLAGHDQPFRAWQTGLALTAQSLALPGLRLFGKGGVRGWQEVNCPKKAGLRRAGRPKNQNIALKAKKRRK